MLKPLITMAHVLLFSFVTVQAQSSLDNSIDILCVVNEDQVAQKVDLFLEQTKPITFTCKNENISSIPKFFQFTCNQSDSYLTVQINVTNGNNNQTISKDIEIKNNQSFYEIPLLNLVDNSILQSGKAHLNSIVFKNNQVSSVKLTSINFANISSNHEVNLNQIFTLDLSSFSQSNYLVTLKSDKDVNINLYKSNGEFDHTIAKKLFQGQNYLPFSDMQLSSEKYIVVISDVNSNKNMSNNNMTVMY